MHGGGACKGGDSRQGEEALDSQAQMWPRRQAMCVADWGDEGKGEACGIDISGRRSHTEQRFSQPAHRNRDHQLPPARCAGLVNPSGRGDMVDCSEVNALKVR
jgi:hypothetical protein